MEFDSRYKPVIFNKIFLTVLRENEAEFLSLIRVSKSMLSESDDLEMVYLAIDPFIENYEGTFRITSMADEMDFKRSFVVRAIKYFILYISRKAVDNDGYRNAIVKTLEEELPNE